MDGTSAGRVNGWVDWICLEPSRNIHTQCPENVAGCRLGLNLGWGCNTHNGSPGDLGFCKTESLRVVPLLTWQLKAINASTSGDQEDAAFLSWPIPQRRACSSLPDLVGRMCWLSASQEGGCQGCYSYFYLRKFLDSQQNWIESADISHIPLTPHLGVSPSTTSCISVAHLFPHDKPSLPPPPYQSLQVCSLHLGLALGTVCCMSLHKLRCLQHYLMQSFHCLHILWIPLVRLFLPLPPRIYSVTTVFSPRVPYSWDQAALRPFILVSLCSNIHLRFLHGLKALIF